MEQDQRQHKWAQHVAAWRGSGMSQQAYARAQGLAVSSLSYWIHKLGPQARSEGFAQAQVLGAEGSLRLQGPGGWELYLPPSVPASWVAALLSSMT